MRRFTLFPRGCRLPLAIALAPAFPSAAHADTVTDWNAIMQATVSAPPTNAVFQTRWGAIVQLAVFEAVNAIEGDYEPYLGVIVAPAGASPDAAAIAAAHRTLVTLRPASAAALDALRAASLAAIPDGQAKEDGIAVGEAAAVAMLLLRADDGSGCRRALHAGDRTWRLAADAARFAPAFLPGWGQVTPFGLEEGSQFRLPPPPALHTGKYANDYNEVKLLGRDRTALSARKIAPMSRASTPPPPRCRCLTRPRARSAPRRASRFRRTRGSSPCWRWPWAMPPSRAGIPSTTTTSGGP